MSKYMNIINGKTNIISCDAEFASRFPTEIFEVPDEVKTGWDITDDGKIVRPAVYGPVYNEIGQLVGRIKIEDESYIEI